MGAEGLGSVRGCGEEAWGRDLFGEGGAGEEAEDRGHDREGEDGFHRGGSLRWSSSPGGHPSGVRVF